VIGKYYFFAYLTKIINIDINPVEIEKYIIVNLNVICDPKQMI